MPPKPYQNFPSKKEREDLMEALKQAEQNGDALTSGEHYKNYIQSLKQLNETMDRYYTPDQDGSITALEQKGKDELMSSILKTATLGETLLADVANKGGKLTTSTPGLVSRVQSMMSQDYEMLSLYDPKKDEMTLPEIQQDARTQVIDLRGVQIGKLGNMQSSRLPMTVVDATGKPRSGVFTKASHVSVAEPFKELTEQAAAQCSDEKIKEQIKNIIPRYREYLQDNQNMDENILPGGMEPKDASDEMIVGKMYQQIMWRQSSINIILENSGVDMGNFSGPAKRILTEGMAKSAREPAHWVNGLELGLKDGDRLDQRNSAMSAVANLLGVSKLVARSNNMKFLDEDGQVVEGTFMDFADGMDLQGQDKLNLFAHVDDEPFDAPSNLSKDIADLQVLDYICGNVDRHAGNLFYDVDEKTGKIKGVQGIDNDSAFGLFSSGKDKTNFRLNGTDSLKVVSEDMAKKINGISPEMLKFTLRGRGLTDKEINAACERLNDVKAAVKKAQPAKNIAEVTQNINFNKLSVMSAETLREMPPQTFKPRKFEQKVNLFGDVVNRIDNSIEVARQQGIAYQPGLNRQASNNLKEVSTTGRRFTAAGIGESLRGMSRMIRNEVTGFVVEGLSKFLRSSGQFRTMVAAVKDANRLSAQIKQEIGENGALDREDPKVRKQLEKADRAMENVRKATDAYLKKKMKEKNVQSLDQLVGKSAYEQKRIDYARKLMQSVKEYDEIARPEKQEAKAEKEAVKGRANLAAQRQAKKAKKEEVQPLAMN